MIIIIIVIVLYSLFLFIQVQNAVRLFLILPGIRVLRRKFRNSPLFTAACANRPSARRVSAASGVCTDMDALGNPVFL
jgi:hypothetical protein